MILPRDSGDRIEAAVAKAEEHTSAELVVVGRPFSGSYRDVEYRFGLACALAFLGWALYSERTVPPAAVIPGLVTAWLLGWFLCRWSPHLRRLQTTPARRRRQAHDLARLTFLEQGVDGTSARTGVLVHVSFLERAVDLIADRGVGEVFSPQELAEMGEGLGDVLRRDGVDAFCEHLDGLGRQLGTKLPRSEDDVDELANAPVFHAHGGDGDGGAS